jgi:hypothetical protein
MFTGRPPVTDKKRKPTTELPTEDAIRKLFPKKVVDEAKREAHRKDDPKAGGVHKDTVPKN